MSLPPTVQSLAGRYGGLRLHATTDSALVAARARAGILTKFAREAVAEAEGRGESLTAVEIDRRARFARRAHMARLALRSAQARATKKAAR